MQRLRTVECLSECVRACVRGSLSLHLTVGGTQGYLWAEEAVDDDLAPR